MRRAGVLSLAIAGLGVSIGLGGCDLPQASYRVSSVSMRPTLEKGTVVGADKIHDFCGATLPKPGDIVVYRREGVSYIHRVVAGPGQTVEMSAGRLTIDHRAIPSKVVGAAPGEYGRSAQVVQETLPNGAQYRTLDSTPAGDLDKIAPYIVRPNSWYVLGDNRDNSADSRVYGSVSQADICATLTSVVWAKELSRVGHRP